MTPRRSDAPFAEPAARERVTKALVEVEAARSDEGRPADSLLEGVYSEMRRLAASYLRRERSGHTLQPTALVHEAYLALADQDRVSWKGRSHFFAVGAKVMRRLLVDHARKRSSAKRGGDWHRVTLEEGGSALLGRPLAPAEILALDQALEELAAIDARQARVVELRFFGGLSMAEVARHLDVSKRTVEGDWAHARAWLRRALAGERGDG